MLSCTSWTRMPPGRSRRAIEPRDRRGASARSRRTRSRARVRARRRRHDLQRGISRQPVRRRSRRCPVPRRSSATTVVDAHEIRPRRRASPRARRPCDTSGPPRTRAAAVRSPRASSHVMRLYCIVPASRGGALRGRRAVRRARAFTARSIWIAWHERSGEAQGARPSSISSASGRRSRPTDAPGAMAWLRLELDRYATHVSIPSARACIGSFAAGGDRVPAELQPLARRDGAAAAVGGRRAARATRARPIRRRPADVAAPSAARRARRPDARRHAPARAGADRAGTAPTASDRFVRRRRAGARRGAQAASARASPQSALPARAGRSRAASGALYAVAEDGTLVSAPWDDARGGPARASTRSSRCSARGRVCRRSRRRNSSFAFDPARLPRRSRDRARTRASISISAAADSSRRSCDRSSAHERPARRSSRSISRSTSTGARSRRRSSRRSSARPSAIRRCARRDVLVGVRRRARLGRAGRRCDGASPTLAARESAGRGRPTTRRRCGTDSSTAPAPSPRFKSRMHVWLLMFFPQDVAGVSAWPRSRCSRAARAAARRVRVQPAPRRRRAPQGRARARRKAESAQHDAGPARRRRSEHGRDRLVESRGGDDRHPRRVSASPISCGRTTRARRTTSGCRSPSPEPRRAYGVPVGVRDEHGRARRALRDRPIGRGDRADRGAVGRRAPPARRPVPARSGGGPRAARRGHRAIARIATSGGVSPACCRTASTRSRACSSTA